MGIRRLLKKTYHVWRTDGVKSVINDVVRYITRRSVKSAEYKHLQIVKMYGCVDSLRLAEEFDYALKLPFPFVVPRHNFRIAAVVHIFYPELIDEIIKALNNIPGSVDIYISTDTAVKKAKIEAAFADFANGDVTVKIFPNRGRDIAPTFVGFADIYENYDVAVHIHSKKSAHDADKLANWCEYLYKSN